MNPEDSSERPSKRAKMAHGQSQENGNTDHRNSNKNKTNYRPQQGRNPGQSNKKSRGGREITTISASGIHSNDVGIFVTSDKGQERKCLHELSDLLEEFFDQIDKTPDNDNDQPKTSNGAQEKGAEVDIEADILAELDSLRPSAAEAAAPSPQKLSLITLDIACVSFVRFPSTSTADPVEIVRKLCTSAADRDHSGPRSRYIKRLTPVSLVRKTLNDGLESLCDEILPSHFQLDEEDPTTAAAAADTVTTESIPPTSSSPGAVEAPPTPQPVKFAIRPTIRNNNKIDRDEVIRTVAEKIGSLGHARHKVDLKGYDKLVLVDVYRNIVGMSVVGAEYDKLKRFNLSEIHASHFEEEKKEEKEKQ